jgi:XTP/dITP diphosphohydrolase
MIVLVATTNAGKLREIHALLAGLPIDLRLLDASADIAAPEETGATFAENARLKACYYAHATGLLTIAEDSGLEIDALGGRPGVLSARYPGATYAERFRNLYAELASPQPPTLLEEPNPAWTARFACAVAVARGDDILFETRGTVEGFIAATPRGTHGFGYDPIFFYPPYGATFGEVTDEEKSGVSARGAAFRALRVFLSHLPPA